ncbi:MAG: hypothetical protein INQ03_07325 [Candidatus Heimdallarchaeota archaeon]|nr:hypothetical protein [Candidatus Heimdallarchaeota archaeon]
MSESNKSTLPWVAIPGVKRPQFVFNKIKFVLPTRIPSNFIFLAIFLSILYIYIGGVYNLVEDPLAFGGGEDGNPILIYPSQDRQFLIEGLVAGLVMMMGALGLYLINSATNDPHDTSRAVSYQTFGVILIVIAFFILNNMYNCKIDSTAC